MNLFLRRSVSTLQELSSRISELLQTAVIKARIKSDSFVRSSVMLALIQSNTLSLSHGCKITSIQNSINFHLHEMKAGVYSYLAACMCRQTQSYNTSCLKDFEFNKNITVYLRFQLASPVLFSLSPLVMWWHLETLAHLLLQCTPNSA